jgi:hypothetical protein
MNILPWLDDFSAQRDPRIAAFGQGLDVPMPRSGAMLAVSDFGRNHAAPLYRFDPASLDIFLGVSFRW